MRVLLLEDNEFRIKFFMEKVGFNNSLEVVDNATKAIELLKNTLFDCIFLDNDLGIGNGEGVDVAKFLHSSPDNLNNQSIIIIHSWNKPASEAMKINLPNAVLFPFNTNLFDTIVLTSM